MPMVYGGIQEPSSQQEIWYGVTKATLTTT